MALDKIILKRCWDDAQSSQLSFEEWLLNFKEVKGSPDVIDIINKWNSFNVTPSVRNISSAEVIKIVQNSISNYGVQDCLDAIQNYNTILTDKTFFFKYIWDIKKFFKQSNAAPEFMNSGSMWLNYISRASSPAKKIPYSKLSVFDTDDIKLRCSKILGSIKSGGTVIDVIYNGDDESEYEDMKKVSLEYVTYKNIPIIMCHLIDECDAYLDVELPVGNGSTYIQRFSDVDVFDRSRRITSFDIKKEYSKLSFKL